MGHRALVAYGREDGSFDVYYSHWGGADLAVAGRLGGPAADPVAEEPLAERADFATVVGRHLDPLVHEALFVLDDEPRVYRTLWLDLGAPADAFADASTEASADSSADSSADASADATATASADASVASANSSADGLLVAVDWTDPCDDERVRAWFAGARAVAVACQEREALTRTVAATVVEQSLRDWADDREVIRPPAGRTRSNDHG